MKSLLSITAICEGATGLALAVVPTMMVSLLLGKVFSDSNSILMVRLSGVALIALAFACWYSRNNTKSSLMVKLLIGYNLFSILLFISLALFFYISGPGLWPAVLIHFVLLLWCWSSLRKPVS